MRMRERVVGIVTTVRADGDLRRAWLSGVVAMMIWSSVVAVQARDKNWAWLPAAGLVTPGGVVLLMASSWGRRNAKHVALSLRAGVVAAIAIGSLMAADDVAFAVSLLLACVGPALGIWVAESVVHSRADREAQQRASDLQTALVGISDAATRHVEAAEIEARRRPRIAGRRRR